MTTLEYFLIIALLAAVYTATGATLKIRRLELENEELREQFQRTWTGASSALAKKKQTTWKGQDALHDD